ncbi:TniQ family protein [Streptomyces sp. UG1]|uniref:TniQ family protein n=1 Tax=Streptomyces sp. UG1 TaxID=3417652 RepID=UPI003CF640C7
MSVVRSLPLRTAPIPGEALDSWLEALAAQLRTPMGDLLCEVGLPDQHRPHGWTPSTRHTWLTLLAPDEAEHLSAATGLARATLMR